MALYQTTTDCTRILYFESVLTCDTIAISDDMSGFAPTVLLWSYSLDQSTWSEWTTAEDSLAEAAGDVGWGSVDVFLRVQVTTVKIASDTGFANYQINSIEFDSVSVGVRNIEIVSSTVLINTRKKGLLNPYRNVDPQRVLFNKMSRSVSDIFGFICIYFRVEPDESTSDITFKSYRLSDVADFKSLQVVINENELPGNRMVYSELDIDFQDELEIHIVKEVWQEVFGTSQPDANDFLYLPLTNRMYEVNTASSGDTFMNVSPFWKAYLVRYENRASVNKDDDAFAKLSEYADFAHDFESEKQEEELFDAVKPFAKVKLDDRDLAVATGGISVGDLDTIRYSYNWNKVAIDTAAFNYPFVATANQVSLIAWFKPTVEGQVMAQLGELSLRWSNSGPSVMMKNELLIVASSIVPNTTLELGSFYGLVMNWQALAETKIVTLTVFDTNLDKLFEVSDTNAIEIERPTSLDIMGQLQCANIRVGKQFIAPSAMIAELSTLLPSSSAYYVLDNAIPTLSEPTTDVN